MCVVIFLVVRNYKDNIKKKTKKRMTFVIVFLAMRTYEHNNNNKTKTMMTRACHLPSYEDLSTHE
jgi:hypothetical protein